MVFGTSLLVEVIALLLSRRTRPGEGHLVLSEVELEDQLRRTLETRIKPGDDIEAALRSLRNELVHGTLAVKFVGDKVVLRNFSPCAVDVLGQRVSPTTPGRRAKESHVFVTETAVRDALKVDSDRHEVDVVLDSVATMADGFLSRVVEASELFGKLDNDEAWQLGRSAAERALASARWSQIVGDRLDTTQVAQLLGMSRQALSKRQTSGSLLGLRGEGTTWYPAWQFDMVKEEVRPHVRDLIGIFRDQLPDVDPLVIASWAATPQPEDLDGMTPAQWLVTGGDLGRLHQAARRAASRLVR